MLKKIISIGQNGVDQGALEAALPFEYEIGVWCPPNHKAEDGRIPDYLSLIEIPN